MTRKSLPVARTHVDKVQNKRTTTVVRTETVMAPFCTTLRNYCIKLSVLRKMPGILLRMVDTEWCDEMITDVLNTFKTTAVVIQLSLNEKFDVYCPLVPLMPNTEYQRNALRNCADTKSSIT